MKKRVSAGRSAGLLVVAGTLALSCGAETTEEAATDCCMCLVDEGCVKPDEYDFCKDALKRGQLRISGLRSLTCDSDACVARKQCSSGGDSGSSPEPSDDEDNETPSGGGGGDEYVLIVESAVYGEVDQDGEDWDLLPGDAPPDPFVSVRIDGESIGTTSTVADDYRPAWTDEFVLSVGSSTTLAFRFFDADGISGDDYGGEYIVEDLEGAIADGGRSVQLSDMAVEEVTFSIRRR